MIKDPRFASGMLAAAEQMLKERVIAGPEDERRFAGLMTASGLAIARRALDAEKALADSHRAVVALAPEPSPFADRMQALTMLIRAGAYDGDPEAHRRLLADAETRVAVTKPGALDPMPSSEG